MSEPQSEVPTPEFLAKSKADFLAKHNLEEYSPTREELEAECKRLWDIIDGIDSASDAFKPESSPYTRRVDTAVQGRHSMFMSDGYGLFAVRKKA